MRCPAKKEWVLFYYQDQPAQAQAALARHLAACVACRGLYDAVCATLRGVSGDQPKLTAEELGEIIAHTRSRVAGSRRKYPGVDFGAIVEYVRQLFLKPQLAFVSVAVVVALVALSVRSRQLHSRLQEGIIDVELELAFEDDAVSTLDEAVELQADEFTARPGAGRTVV